MENEQLTKAVAAVVPQKLDDIIRAHRDEVSLRYSTQEDKCALIGPIASPPADWLTDWRMVTIDIRLPTRPHTLWLMALGKSRVHGEPRITSPIRALDVDRQVIRTNSGTIYELRGPESIKEADYLLICHWLTHKSKLGSYCEVLEIFY